MSDKKKEPPLRENTFKYVSFSEQVARLNTDNLTSTLGLQTHTNDYETYFYEAVFRWNEIDYGDDYKAFLDDIPYEELATYAQLLHYKEQIATSLNYHLTLPESKAVKALLDIGVAFVRDLKDDFYPFLWPFFDAVISVIEHYSKDAEILESGFKSLAILFQMHWRSIVKTLRKTFVRFSPLFTHNFAYIRRFAAEAFSFLLRKSPSIPKLTTFLYEQAQVAESKHIKDGVAQLFFNGFKGTHKQFHSKTDELLSVFVKSALELAPGSTTREIAQEILVSVMILCCQWSKVEYTTTLTSVLLRILNETIATSSQVEADCALLFALLDVWVTQRKGNNFVQAVELFDAMKTLSAKPSIQKVDGYLDLLSKVLNTYFSKFSDPAAIRQVIVGATKNNLQTVDAESVNAVFEFFGSLLTLPIFDIWIISSVADLVNTVLSESTEDAIVKPVLKFFSVFVVSRRHIGETVEGERKPFVDVRDLVKLRDVAFTIIERSEEPSELKDYALISFPWLCRVNESPKILPLLRSTYKAMFASPASTCPIQNFLITHSLSLFRDSVIPGTSVDEVLDFLSAQSNLRDEIPLRLAFLVLSSSNAVEATDHLAILERLAVILEPCFSAPDGIIRRFALKLLNIFDAHLPHEFTNKDGETEQAKSVFAVLLEAENTPADMHNYRQRGALLRSLHYSILRRMLPVGGSDELKKIPVMIFLSQLFERFTLLWPMIHEIVESYAHVMPLNLFWPVMQKAIDESTAIVRSPLPVVEDSEVEKILDLHRNVVHNYVTYRIQVLKIMTRFPGIAERRNKEVVPLLLDVYRTEYLPVCAGAKKTMNLSEENEIEAAEEPAAGAEDVEDVHEETEESETTHVTKSSKTTNNFLPSVKQRRKQAIDALVPLLDVFAHISSPLSVCREPELKQLYDELLISNITSLQKGAFHCILTYRYPFMKPYVENLERLFNNGLGLRSELTVFTVDAQTSVVEPIHRGPLMPFLMKILYGQLKVTVTVRGAARRASIFNFLSGCTADELDIFLEILFKDVIDHCGISRDLSTENLLELSHRIIDSYDYTATLSPRKLRSLLNNVEDVTKRMTPSLSTEQCHYLFRIVTALGILIERGIENEGNIAKWLISSFKALRIQYFGILAKVFERFNKVKFSLIEIDALTQCVFEPHIYKFNTEHNVEKEWGLLSAITNFYLALMKLPMFYALLIRPYSDKCQKETPMNLILNTLNSNSCEKKLETAIVDGISNLLTLEHEATAVPELPEAKIKPRDRAINMGTEIVLRYLEKVIQFLVAAIPTDAAAARSMPVVYLNILNTLSPYVTDAQVGEHFANTLLTYVEAGRGVRGEDKLIAVLRTIAGLVHFVSDPKTYLSRLPILLSTLRGRAPREALMGCIQAIAAHEALKNATIAKHLGMIVDLEAWDKQRLMEPDAERRYAALSELSKLYSSKTDRIDPINVQFFARSHAFTVAHISDLSLRAAAADAFRDLITYAAGIYEGEVLKTLVYHTFNNLIANGLRSTADYIRDEFTRALEVAVNNFSEYDESLKSIHQFQNKDVEVDFFANITHIQFHRRIRACQRLTAALADENTEIPYTCLTKYIMPIVKPYFLSTESKISALSDESLNVLREILRRATWQRYYAMLETYVNMLAAAENSKPVVRVIVAILDAFHFELRGLNLEPIEFTAAKHPKKDKRRLGIAVQKHKRPHEGPENPPEVDPDNEMEVDEETEAPITEDERTVAKSILETLLGQVLPKLQECIKPSKHSIGHKKSQAGKFYSEDEELKRVPVALATVKLLQKLPEWVLDQYLHGVVLTLISLLLSRSHEVRQAARKTMEKVIQALGVRFLPFFIREMKEIMTRGYQVHVMIFTMHMLISSMEVHLKTGDLDACLNAIVDVCHQEQFSDTADEKELSTSVPEAKARKTYDTYVLLGKYISCGVLLRVINPMKEVFDKKPNAATSKKLSNLLRGFASGLRANAGIAPEDLLKFTYLILTNNLDDMNKQASLLQPEIDAEEKLRLNGYRPESCYILPAAPKRQGVITKTSLKAKSSIFVEFGAVLLANLLKAKAFSPDKPEDAVTLDAFIPVVINCLKLKYEKIIASNLRSLHTLLKFPLPSIKSHCNHIIERLFVILADYAGVFATTTTTELTGNLFKSFNQLIHIAKNEVLTPKRIQILLNYAEADVLDPHKHATAFSLIKTILDKRIVDPKVTEMMTYLSELSITSTTNHIRVNARDILLQYVTTYKLNQAKLEKWVTWYLDQMEYEYEDGRLSAVEMVHSLVTAFSEKVNDSFALLMFIKLAARVVNEESKKCTKFVILALHNLFKCTSEKAHNELFSVTKDWLEAAKEGPRLIAYELFAELVRGIPGLGAHQLKVCLPIIAKHFLELKTDEFSENIVLGILSAFTVLCQVQPVVFIETFVELSKEHNLLVRLNDFLRCVLSRPVQLAASGFLGQLLASFRNEDIKVVHKKLKAIFVKEVGWIEFTYSMCFQLKGKVITDETAEQIIKNLVFLSGQIASDEDYSGFVTRVANVCSKEVVEFTNESTRRKAIFKLTAACALNAANDERALQLTTAMMPHLYREMAGKSAHDTEELKSLSSEVSNILKEKVGAKVYSDLLVECSKKASEKATKRKQAEADLAVTDPQAAALLKRKKMEKKAELRKRKLDTERPFRAIKRRQRESMRKKLDDADAEFFDE